MADKRIVNMAVFLSGGGTTLQNFIDKIEQGELPATISVVLSSRKDAYGLVRARENGIPTIVVPSREYKRNWSAMSEAINRAIEPYNVDIIALAGYMCFYMVPPHLEGRVMNIHPALIPNFCGEKFYGSAVHKAVIEAGAKESGCTVHFVDNEYDHGPIIIQKKAPVMDGDTVDTLAARVFEQECIAYPEAIRLFAEGKLKIQDGKVTITD